MTDLGLGTLSKLTVFSKYAKYNPQLKRRETWEEIIDRYENMLSTKYPSLKEEIKKNTIFIREKKVLPSMRALQFAGIAMEVNNARGYNCCFLPVDSYHAFSEAMFLLLGGTGVGYSVQFHHVEKLPAIKKPVKSRHYLIEDSIMGWADAIKMLMKAYLKDGSLPKFDFRAIREKGARLVTAGGKAPGPEPLKECLFQIQKILDRKQDGEKLSPLECHDIMCHIANSVLAGGIRRSAMISLFSHNDEEMITCKYGNWWELNEQRGRANNSAVLKREKIEKEEFDSLWKRIEASGSGEPGIYWTNDLDWGTNPSLRAGTKVLTTEGIFPIEQLKNKEFKVKNLNGEISKAKCWLSGKNKQLWKITLQGGKSYYATPEHEWPIWDGEKYIKVKTPDIISGDKLPILRENSLFNGKKGTLDEGFLVGWMLGDGWKTTRKDYSEYGIIVSSKDEKSGICSLLENSLKNVLPSFSGKFHKRYKNVFGQDEEEMQIVLEETGNFEISINNKDFDKEFQKRFGEVHKSTGLPKFVFEESSEEFRKGLIDGLFSSDGHVEKNKKRLVYTSKYLKLVEDLQELLGFYGIKSNIKKSTSILKNKSFERYDLRITEGASIKHFKSLFTFTNKYKQETLDSYEFRYNIHDSKQIEVISVELSDITEDVWDISVFDNTHCFQLSNCITGNCCEIALRPFQFCNLCEVNVSNIENQKDLNERVEIASFFGSLQAGFTEFHYLRPIWKKTTEKDALLGIGMTGIGSGEILKYNLEEATQYAISKNREVSEKIGINPATRATCIKPSGTTSLVLGTASGIHAWHNDYYLRTMRFGKNEDVAAYLMINHPVLCEDDVLRPNDTVCVRIPVKAPEGSIFRTETAIDTLERVKKFSQEWIKPGHINGANTHNVSATISIDKNRIYTAIYDSPENISSKPFYYENKGGKFDEWFVVGEWMWDNKNVYNGLSVLPYFGGSYKQAPFEDITEDEYNERIKSLKSLDLTNVIEIDDHVDFGQVSACSGGSCSLE